MNIILLISILVIVGLFGGGGGYFLYLRMFAPKKELWNCRVYRVSEAIRTEEIKDKEGNFLKSLKLNDLVPYTLDKIEKRVEEGITIYELQKLKKTITGLSGNETENWGLFKNVDILYIEDECTPLKKGYDKESGDCIYLPLGRDRMDSVTQAVFLKQQRHKQKVDAITKITPWVIAGMSLISLVFMVYFMINGNIQINEKTLATSEDFAKEIEKSSVNYKEASIIYRDATGGILNNLKDLELKFGDLEQKQQELNITLGKITKKEENFINKTN